MNRSTFLDTCTFCLLKTARIKAEKSDCVANCHVHMFLPGMPILFPNCLEDLGVLGALEPPLVPVLVGRQPLLRAELLPAGGAGELLPLDLGVLLIKSLTCLFIDLNTASLRHSETKTLQNQSVE